MLFAQDIDVYVWDGNPDDKTTINLRFYVSNNDPVAYKDVNVRFKISRPITDELELEKIYSPNSTIEFFERDNYTYLNVSIKDLAPLSTYPSEDGFSFSITDMTDPNADISQAAIEDGVVIHVGEEKIDNQALPVTTTANITIKDEDVITTKITPTIMAEGSYVFQQEDEIREFSWEPVEGAMQYRFTMFTTFGRPITQALTRSTSVRVPTLKGSYKWMVEALNANNTYRGTATLTYARMENAIGFHVVNMNSEVNHTLVAESETEVIMPIKDTKMLLPNLAQNADLDGWDKMTSEGYETIYGYDKRISITMHCWAVVIHMINHKYGGTLTQDEITAYGNALKSGDPIFGVFRHFLGNGASGTVSEKTLEWALNTTVEKIGTTDMAIADIEAKIKAMLDENKPVMTEITGHMEMIDALYKDPNGKAFVRVLNGLNTNFKPKYEYLEDVGIIAIFDFELPKVGTIRMTDKEHSVFKDSDNDGIVDYDEVHRFNSNPNSKDSDSDGISDYTEVYAYVKRMMVPFNISYTEGVNNSYYIVDNQKTLAAKFQELYNNKQPWTVAEFDESSKDGDLKGFISDKTNLPWWNKDSDGDGINDGDEDKNHNGVVDAGETDPINPFDGKNGSKYFYDVPEGFALYAMEKIDVGENVYCPTLKKYLVTNKDDSPAAFYDRLGSVENDLACHVASEGESATAVSLGSGSMLNDIYTKGGATINNAIANTIYTYNATATLGTVNATGANRHKRVIAAETKNWINFVNTDLPNYDAGEKKVVVEKGDTLVLKDGDRYKSIFITESANLIIEPGEMYVGDIQLNDNAVVTFSKPKYSTILHVNGLVIWHAKINTTGAETIAKHFKLIQHSTDDVVIFDGQFLGTIFAPKSNVELGENAKDIYGRYLGKKLKIYSDTKIHEYAFEEVKYEEPQDTDTKDTTVVPADTTAKDTTVVPADTSAKDSVPEAIIKVALPKSMGIKAITRNSISFEVKSTKPVLFQIVKENGVVVKSFRAIPNQIGLNTIGWDGESIAKGKYIMTMQNSINACGKAFTLK